MRALRKWRDFALARLGQRSIQLLPPVCDVAPGAIDINHVHWLVAGIGELVKKCRRHENRLSRPDRTALRTDTDFALALYDEINLLLLLVVPRHLPTARFKDGITHRKTLGRNRLAELADEPAAPASRRKSASGKLGKVRDNHRLELLREGAARREPFLRAPASPATDSAKICVNRFTRVGAEA